MARGENVRPLTHNPYPLTPIPRLPLLFLFGAPFVVYAFTLAPSITWAHGGADGGDLIVAAYSLGIAHPPGYPLYALVGRIFTLLPFGEMAWRLNLMSAFFAALTAPLIYAIVLTLASTEILRSAQNDRLLPEGRPEPVERHAEPPIYHSEPPLCHPEPPLCHPERSEGSRDRAVETQSFSRRTASRTARALSVLSPSLGGAAAALLISWAPLFWSQAVIAEVYTLNAFLLSAGLLLVLRARHASGSFARIYPYLLAFILGLGLGNHLSLLLLAPFALAVTPPNLRPNFRTLPKVTGVAFSLLLGLSIYVYLPLRAAQHPVANWGDPQTLDRFWWMVTAQQYRSLLFALPLDQVLSRLPVVVRLLTDQFGWIGALLGLLGLAVTWKRDRSFFAASITVVALDVFYAINYAAENSQVYLLPAFIIWAIWLGLGVSHVLAEVSSRGDRFARPLTVVVSVAVIALPAVSLALNYGPMDLNADWIAKSYATSVLSQLPARAVIVTGQDEETFGLWYAQQAQDVRPDIAVVDQRLLQWPWYKDNLRQNYRDLSFAGENTGELAAFVAANIRNRPVCFASDQIEVPEGYSLHRAGPVFILKVK